MDPIATMNQNEEQPNSRDFDDANDLKRKRGIGLVENRCASIIGDNVATLPKKRKKEKLIPLSSPLDASNLNEMNIESNNLANSSAASPLTTNSNSNPNFVPIDFATNTVVGKKKRTTKRKTQNDASMELETNKVKVEEGEKDPGGIEVWSLQ
jgi:hypothetical protein